MVARRIHQDDGISIGFETAQALLVELFAAGVVGPVNLETHAYPVLLDRENAMAALDTYKGHTDWATLYECPQCSRVAAWTDGRKISLGDEADEFWCQTCGAEAPLVSCAVIAAA
ncbi:hypothetical protein GPZ77_34760 (plasmid) [Streptomyces sp. QHH-9511]|uniref:hypothetical protein n=1 Tax=Streptomyces sp. QHH-9511 TaxID=2684468 RepID=UPI001318D664|nr:hypothetical protein [Streptomyces sp. QHH-9511]QGZ53390.1 hypothetical protein GPZ77_34760 [Streptomyces sp. QHH-9511]